MRPLNEFSVGLPSPRPQITRWSRVGLTQSGGEDLLISAFALRHLLRMLYGESHAVALRRDRAPLEGRSRVLFFFEICVITLKLCFFILLWYLFWCFFLSCRGI